MEPSSVKRRLTCILAADAVGYSKQMSHDEEGTIRVLQAHRSVIDGIIAFHQGRLVSTAGDSVLAEFSSAVEAVRCAVEVQDALKTRNDSLPDHRKMFFRVGVNLGDVVVEQDDLLGDGVNVAARLESMAEPGGICIASSVYDQITGKLDLGFQDIGQQNLKNISRPIHVYRVSGTVPLLRTTPMVAQPQPQSPLPSVPAPHARWPVTWSLVALAVVAISALAAWQGGWMRFGAPLATGPAVATAPLPVADRIVPKSINADAPDLAQTVADAQRLLAEAKAMKHQAETEIARSRIDARANQADKPKDAPSVEASAKATPVPVAAAPRETPVVSVAPTAASVVAVEVDKSTRAPTTGVGRFNGRWSVAVDCSRHEDGALGYQLDFVAEVKEGLLHGEVGTPGNPGWLVLQGDIQPDGRAMLHAKGLTNDSRLSVKRVGKGTPYAYQVEAHFEGSHGTGRRMQLRACRLNFDKQ